MTKASKPVTTTTPAGRAVASNALANRQRIAREEAEAKRADTTTPIGETKAAFEMEDLFSNPAPQPAKRPIIVLSTTVAYRGRIVTISNEGMTLDAFCDMLDKRFGVAS